MVNLRFCSFSSQLSVLSCKWKISKWRVQFSIEFILSLHFFLYYLTKLPTWHKQQKLCIKEVCWKLVRRLQSSSLDISFLLSVLPLTRSIIWNNVVLWKSPYLSYKVKCIHISIKLVKKVLKGFRTLFSGLFTRFKHFWDFHDPKTLLFLRVADQLGPFWPAE